MAERPRIVVIRKAEFRARDIYASWSDPEGIAAVNETRREVMLRNPLSVSDDYPMQLVGLRGSTVIGSTLVIPGRIIIGGQERPFSWASALCVSPAARATMVGLKLVLELQNLCETVGVCGVSHAAHLIYKGFGWTDFVMPRHIVLRRSRAVLEQKLGNDVVSKMLGPMVDAGLAGLNAWILRQTRSDLSAEVVETVPADVSDQLASSARRYGNTFLPRCAEVLQWQLGGCVAKHSWDRNLFVAVYSRRVLAGYALVKMKFYPVASSQGFKNLHLGSIQDWMVFDQSAITYHELIVAACRVLIDRGADAVELCASNAPEEATLKSMHLPRVGEVHLMWRASPGTMLDNETFRNRENWMIRPGDDDLFM